MYQRLHPSLHRKNVVRSIADQLSQLANEIYAENSSFWLISFSPFTVFTSLLLCALFLIAHLSLSLLYNKNKRSVT